MIAYTLENEKETILHYANLLNDKLTMEIIERGSLENKDEANHLALFFWEMVRKSNEEDKKTDNNSEFILEKIINTLMAYYRESGYEEQWEEISDKQ